MVKFFRDSMEAMIGGGVDLLFANEDEAMELAGSDNLADAVQLFKNLARKFAITRGSKGALLFDGSMEIDIKPRPVEALDTLGAGDMFAGAMLYGLSQGMNFQRAGDLAALASAKIVTQFGPRLRAEQTRELLSTFNRDNA
jgi:sugar/nucleoside kinase (ribokinase family)